MAQTTEAIFNKEDIIEVGTETIADLKRLAIGAPRRRFRLCLHQSLEEHVQEMIIVLCRDAYIRPHRHPRGKSESYHVIEGEMTVLFFDDTGKVTRTIDLAAHDNGHSLLYRLSANVWHMPVPKSEVVVYHETFTGPFDNQQDVEYATWAPDDSNMAVVASFLKKVSSDN